MRYLTTALVSEGPSDDRLLPRLLTRALEELCSTEFTDDVEIPDVVPLRHRSGPPSIDGILDLVRRNAGSFYIVFVHRDQGASLAKFDRQWRLPLQQRWPDGDERLVLVVPVRETEAWVLADGNALRKTLGVRWSDRELGVPARPRDVEKIEDPKVPLARLEQRVGRRVENYYERFSELVSLDVLQRVKSFQDWRNEVISTLASLGFRRRYRDSHRR